MPGKAGPLGVTLWPRVSAEIAFGQTLISPAFVGIAAWVARNERRRGMDDLLRTAAISRAHHVLIVWSATAAWGLLSYAAAGCVVGALAARSATRGGPDWAPILAGAAAVLAATALGFVLGTLLPSSFLPPLWAIGWWLLDGYLALRADWLQFFAPRTLYENVGRSIFHEPAPAGVDERQAAWWLGCAVFCLALALARIERSRRAWVLTGAALLVAVTPAVTLARTPTNTSVSAAKGIACQPVCVEREIRVCVHPAEQRLLNEAAATITAVVAPLVGIPGAPRWARQQEDGERTPPADVLTFPLYDATSLQEQLVWATAFALVSAPLEGDPKAAGPPLLSFPQAVVGTWLFQQAGYPGELSHFWMMPPDFRTLRGQEQFDDARARMAQAVARFDSLSPSARQTWLSTHYQALRAGKADSASLP